MTLPPHLLKAAGRSEDSSAGECKCHTGSNPTSGMTSGSRCGRDARKVGAYNAGTGSNPIEHRSWGNDHGTGGARFRHRLRASMVKLAGSDRCSENGDDDQNLRLEEDFTGHWRI